MSVVIAVHDGGRFVGHAVQSLLGQTLREVQLIVVDDASGDDTAAQLASLAEPRLEVLRLEENQGPFAAANLGLERARGEFIARLDADDVALPGRLEAQVDFLARNPEVGLVGSCCLDVDEAGRQLGHHWVPQSDAAIRARCLLAPPFVHSTVMWRRSLGLRYDSSFRVAGDYELWTRALSATRASNLAEPLVLYRVWGGGITATSGELQRTLHDAISLRFIESKWPQLRPASAAHRELRRRAAGDGAGPPLSEAAQELAAALRRLVGTADRDDPEPSGGLLGPDWTWSRPSGLAP